MHSTGKFSGSARKRSWLFLTHFKWQDKRRARLSCNSRYFRAQSAGWKGKRLTQSARCSHAYYRWHKSTNISANDWLLAILIGLFDLCDVIPIAICLIIVSINRAAFSYYYAAVVCSLIDYIVAILILAWIIQGIILRAKRFPMKYRHIVGVCSECHPRRIYSALSVSSFEMPCE